MQTPDAVINQQPQTPACLESFYPKWKGVVGQARAEQEKNGEANRLPGFAHREQMKSSGQGAYT